MVSICGDQHNLLQFSVKATYFPGIPLPVTKHHDDRGLTNIGCLSRSSLYLSSLWAGQDSQSSFSFFFSYLSWLSAVLHGLKAFSACSSFFLSFIGSMPNKSLKHLPLSWHLLTKEATCQKSLKLHIKKLSRIP